MRRTIAVMAAVIVAAGLGVSARMASAHECPDGPENEETCYETRVFPDYRPNVVPLFDLPDRDDTSHYDDTGDDEVRTAQVPRRHEDHEPPLGRQPVEPVAVLVHLLPFPVPGALVLQGHLLPGPALHPGDELSVPVTDHVLRHRTRQW